MTKEIRLSNDDDGLFLRDSFILVFFCKTPFKDLAAAFNRVFEYWLETTPEEGRKWASVGSSADEFKPLTPQRLAAARKEMDPAKSRNRDMTALDIGGPQEDNPDYRFACVGNRDMQDEETNCLEIRLPRAPATEAEIAAALTLARQVGAMLPYSSGYAAPALVWGVEGQQMAFSDEIAKLALRHPGYDVPYTMATAFDIGEKLRGAYWLNFIGPAALKKLGGEKGLRGKLDASIGIEKVGDGLLLQAGPKPEVGDVNRKANLPLLRSLAKVLAPVTLLDDGALDNNFLEEEDAVRWKRRHLD